MKNLLAAIFGKTSGSALSSDVGGRIYLDEAPAGCEFPYVVFQIVTASKEKTFTEEFRDTLIQFSLFSISQGVTEITTIYKDLIALFDECALTIPPTGTVTDILVWMREANLVTMVDEITTTEGTGTLKHWAIDFEVKTLLS